MPLAYYSMLRNAARGGTRRFLTGQEAQRQDSVENSYGQGKHLIGKSRSFRSLSTNHNGSLRAGTVLAVRSDSVINQRRQLSFMAALSHTFSIPSVSGPSFQVCRYHIDCVLSSPNDKPISNRLQKALKATCGSRDLLSVSYIDYLAQSHVNIPQSVDYVGRFWTSCSCDRNRKSNTGLRDQGKPNNYLISRQFAYSLYLSNLNSGWKDFSSSSASFSTGAIPDAYCDNPAREEQLTISSNLSEELKPKMPVDRILKLVSGSCYLPHPDKEETGGEDAHFICDDEQAIGVADGVGGWADLGIDSGLFARELMSNSVDAIHEEPKGFVDPSRVLEKAHLSTKAKGSSTACIIALTDKDLHAINLGDSGFMVVRNGCTIFRSPVQQHNFNFTYQLESGNGGDLPSSGQIFSVSVAPGDVIVAGTDGLFDNLYNNEITAVVVHAMRADLTPHATAQKIAALARQRALDKNRQTPFSTAAQDAGFRYYGGKLDDITVLVSNITCSSSTSETRSPETASTSD